MQFNSGEIRYGALAPELHEQIGVDADEVDKEQKLLDAASILYIHGHLPDRTRTKICNKVISDVLKRLEEEGRISRVMEDDE